MDKKDDTENNGNIEKINLNKVDWKSSREFFESLGEALDKLDDKDESYDFTWVGKRNDQQNSTARCTSQQKLGHYRKPLYRRR